MENNKDGTGGALGAVGLRGRLTSGVFLLRVVALALTVAATVVMGVAKQTEIVQLKLLPTLPAFNVPAPAKWRYMSALVYFVVANAIACVYAALSLVACVANAGGGKKKGLTLSVLTLDLLMVALLCSGSGAAGAVGLIGFKGNSHVRWEKVCNVFDVFCRHVAVAILLSLLGAVAFVLLVVLGASVPYKKSLGGAH